MLSLFRRIELEVRDLSSNMIVARYLYKNGRVLRSRNVVDDPAMYGATAALAGTLVAADNTPWWCDAGSRGKLGPSAMCRPWWVSRRRAVALNPWPSSQPSDLDTVIDSTGNNKAGTIGTSPFTFTSSQSGSTSTILVTFVAASDATIASIFLLGASTDTPYEYTVCDYGAVSCKDCCRQGYYDSVYYALWSWDVDISVQRGTPYSVKIVFAPQTG